MQEKFKIFYKAYVVYHKDDKYAVTCGVPNVQTEIAYVEPDDSPSKAISQVMHFFDNANFLDLRAVRLKNFDKVLYKSEVVTLSNAEYKIELDKWRKNMVTLVSKNPESDVLIYSGEWGAYWRKNCCGYTFDKEQAGVYNIKDAWNSVSHCGLSKKISFVFI